MARLPPGRDPAHGIPVAVGRHREGAVDSLLEWELTLQLTLEALGFAVVNGAGRFTVTGPDGSARSFDLIRGGPAEKLFLKILFPLDKRE